MAFCVERIIDMYTIKNTFYRGILDDKKYDLGRKVCGKWFAILRFFEGHQH